MSSKSTHPPRQYLEDQARIDGYLKQIKFKADCLLAYTEGGVCESMLVRDENAVDKLRAIDALLTQSIAELPIYQPITCEAH